MGLNLIEYKTKLRNFPIPGELIVIVGMILFCTFWEHSDTMDLVGEIPSEIKGRLQFYSRTCLYICL